MEAQKVLGSHEGLEGSRELQRSRRFLIVVEAKKVPGSRKGPEGFKEP